MFVIWLAAQALPPIVAQPGPALREQMRIEARRLEEADRRARLDAVFAKMQQASNEPPPPGPGDIIAAKLGKFRGRSSQYAFDRLGYPDRKMLVAGATIYSWVNTDTNLDGGNLMCTIKVIVRGARITNTDYHGNNGACAHFARKLDPAFRGRY